MKHFFLSKSILRPFENQPRFKLKKIVFRYFEAINYVDNVFARIYVSISVSKLLKTPKKFHQLSKAKIYALHSKKMCCL